MQVKRLLFQKSELCCSAPWSHVMAEPFLKCCRWWSVINDNDQLTFIASPVYDWTSELNPSHPWSGGDLSPLLIDKVCLWLMKFPYLHHFWGFALGESSGNSQWGCVWWWWPVSVAFMTWFFNLEWNQFGIICHPDISTTSSVLKFSVQTSQVHFTFSKI